VVGALKPLHRRCSPAPVHLRFRLEPRSAGSALPWEYPLADAWPVSRRARYALDHLDYQAAGDRLGDRSFVVEVDGRLVEGVVDLPVGDRVAAPREASTCDVAGEEGRLDALDGEVPRGFDLNSARG
jgi:hypothetical protein